ncbi:MAG: type II toxin-antitoxin system HicA family toxin [Pseudomonadota bacterium]|nr:type II toxin-antitoxin system HicA family toxin [Pseudomonadota bacterium]
MRVKGSHHFLRRSGASQGVTVPAHGNRDVPSGTLRSIIAQAGLSIDEFMALL